MASQSRTMKFSLMCQRGAYTSVFFSTNLATAYKSETFPFLETRPRNGGACLAIRRLIRGSAFTKATAISLPWSWVEVSTKLLTFADASAVRSVTL
jgi:hypothetical protein